MPKRFPMSPIRYRAGYKYQLVSDVVVQLDWLIGWLKSPAEVDGFLELTPSGRLTIRRGYAWDGPSGPTIDTKSFMRGPLVHDALYQLMRVGVLDRKIHREPADATMLELTEDDIEVIWSGARWSWFRPALRARARAWRDGVRGFAGFAASSANRKPIYEVP